MIGQSLGPVGLGVMGRNLVYLVTNTVTFSEPGSG